jgi:hypothetical protein
MIADVETSGRSGSGVFQADKKCLSGILSAKITDNATHRDIGTFYVQADTIRAFLAALPTLAWLVRSVSPTGLERRRQCLVVARHRVVGFCSVRWLVSAVKSSCKNCNEIRAPSTCCGTSDSRAYAAARFAAVSSHHACGLPLTPLWPRNFCKPLLPHTISSRWYRGCFPLLHSLPVLQSEGDTLHPHERYQVPPGFPWPLSLQDGERALQQIRI